MQRAHLPCLVAVAAVAVGGSASARSRNPELRPRPPHPVHFLAAAPLVAPGRLRPPLQVDFDRCLLAAEDLGNRSLAGKVHLELLLRAAGNVYAAFARHGDGGIDDRRFQRCLTASAPRWVFPRAPVDYQRAYVVAFVHSGVAFSPEMHSGDGITGAGRASAFLPDINDVPTPTRLDEEVAQSTLEIADFATEGERAVAQLSVRRFAGAVQHARLALAANPSDLLALRALAQALIEGGGDPVEARLHAERLVALAPGSVQGHEALLRVCLAAGDDRCAVHEFRRAREAVDMPPRSRLLAELHRPTQLAAFRAARRERAGDPCAGAPDDMALALCVVKRCLDEGSAIYARELASRAPVSYEPGDWRIQPLGGGKLLVTRPIEPAADAPELAVRHDARWVVELGGPRLVVQPQNRDARAITVRHSYCSTRVATQAAH